MYTQYMLYVQFTNILSCVVEFRKLDKLLIPMQALANEPPNEVHFILRLISLASCSQDSYTMNLESRIFAVNIEITLYRTCRIHLDIVVKKHQNTRADFKIYDRGAKLLCNSDSI